MSFIAAERRAREAADNCGASLDAWRAYHRPRIWRGMAYGLVGGAVFWAAAFVVFALASEPINTTALYAPDPVEGMR